MNSSFFGFFAHAGFLDGLQRLGLRPTEIAGASAGALTGGFYAAGYPTDEILGMVRDPEIASLFREGAPGFGRMLGTFLNRDGQTGALSGKRALKMLRRYFGDRRIEDLRDPGFSLSVANLSRSVSQVIHEGPLAEYILASCAVPGMFRAQKIGDEFYWDGGVADPIPFEQWLVSNPNNPGGAKNHRNAKPAKKIRRVIVHLVVNAEDLAERRNPHPSFYKGLGRCHQIISDEIFRLKLELARSQGQEITILRTVAPRPGPGKLELGDRCIELGRKTALSYFADAK
ncbi:MAG: patatin-like phospholipase family protein [bacterium]|nr:patatin-like phospholipase family protein [bacterium]